MRIVFRHGPPQRRVLILATVRVPAALVELAEAVAIERDPVDATVGTRRAKTRIVRRRAAIDGSGRRVMITGSSL